MVKIEQMRPADSLFQARVLRGQPSKVTGLLVLLSSWVIADPLDVFFFLSESSRIPFASPSHLPSVREGKYLVGKVFFHWIRFQCDGTC